MIDEVLEFMGPALRRDRIEVQAVLARNVPAVIGDRWAIAQALLNVVHNACQALHKVSNPRRITVRSSAADGRVRISVADTGPGVSPGDAERVFEPFYTTKAGTEGMGLGLSLSREMAESCGGSLWCERGAGPGATFVLELPAHSELAPAMSSRLAEAPERVPDGVGRPEAPAHDVPAARPAGTGRVLVVEDEVSVLNALLHALSSAGYEAIGAEDGDDALALLRREPFDAILCDVRMPRMDGYRFYEAVSAHDARLAQRIVFASGDTATPAIRTFIVRTGAVLLPKPCGLDEILEAVETVMQRGPQS